MHLGGELHLARAARIADEAKIISTGICSGEAEVWRCLLYTSDAADERSSVDLGGRRIIKKQKRKKKKQKKKHQT